MSDFSRPHGLQPPRLLHPWESSRQEYWSGLPFPSPGDIPNSGIEPRSPALQADAEERPKRQGKQPSRMKETPLAVEWRKDIIEQRRI